MQVRQRALFAVFFASGFCGLLYQIVWLRLAFAQFGIISPVLSVVVSVFMSGLAIGSWGAGRLAWKLSRRLGVSPLILYGFAEIIIGIWGISVPRLFDLSAAALLHLGETSSFSYLLQSALSITLSILPGCILMGTTFPLAAAYIRASPAGDENSFSFLYLANVIGAMSGACLTAAFIIELVGFRNTLNLGAAFNLFAGLVAFWISGRYPLPAGAMSATHELAASTRPRWIGSSGVKFSDKSIFLILFITGLSSMGMEVAWTRAFTPIITTTIYAFAFLLTSYLLATWVGSYFYRRHIRWGKVWKTEWILWWLALASFLPLVINDPRCDPTVIHVFLGIFPLCAVLGYLTPKFIDEYSRGSAHEIGLAYAFNILGCIFGPLIAGYLLLPFVGVKWTLVILALPFVAIASWMLLRRTLPALPVTGLLVFAAVTCAFATTYEDGSNYPGPIVVRRDHTATVISLGQGMEKRLMVNGIGITHMTPITKVMGHLPMLGLDQEPENSLVICFGIGTTFRSLLSWGIEATAVELVPSVRDAFGYYFADADSVLANPKARIVVDDGRRFLKWTDQKFDVITIDPPPPVEAAGSSLLYSREFYDAAKNHLKPHGILQQWYPGGELKTLSSVASALAVSFKHVRVFHSHEGWGYHFLASMDPIVIPTVDQALSKMPDSAKKDLMEWFPNHNVQEIVTAVLEHEVPLTAVIGTEGAVVLTDDRPFNEYFFMRRLPRYVAQLKGF